MSAMKFQDPIQPEPTIQLRELHSTPGTPFNSWNSKSEEPDFCFFHGWDGMDGNGDLNNHFPYKDLETNIQLIAKHLFQWMAGHQVPGL